MSTSCADGKKGEGVGLWQFVVATSGPSVYTGNTVCRYGAIYATPPNCPWNFCDTTVSADCSVCKQSWWDLKGIAAPEVAEASPVEDFTAAIESLFDGADSGAAFGLIAAVAASALTIV